MKLTVYYLGNCSTCKRIIDSLELPASAVLQELKTNPLNLKQIERLGQLSGSYEALFSKRSMQYRVLGLHEMELTESDYKKNLLEHYSFLKRPVFEFEKNIFVGNAKKNIAALNTFLQNA